MLRMDLQRNEHVFPKRDKLQVEDYTDYLNKENNRLIHRVDYMSKVD